jgi:hypothetical protein
MQTNQGIGATALLLALVLSSPATRSPAISSPNGVTSIVAEKRLTDGTPQALVQRNEGVTYRVPRALPACNTPTIDDGTIKVWASIVTVAPVVNTTLSTQQTEPNHCPISPPNQTPHLPLVDDQRLDN